MKTNIFYLLCITILGCSNQETKKNQALIGDSTKILYDNTFILDSVEYRKTVKIDYGNITDFKKYIIHLDSTIRGNILSLDYIYRPDSIYQNKYDILKKTFISISEYKNDYILFSNGEELEYTISYINDSLITFYRSGEWYAYYIQKINEENNKICLHYYSDSTTVMRIDIKTLNAKNNIQIWKFNVDGIVSYDLKAPLEYALKLPALYINNTLGLDCEYDSIDNSFLEERFNE